jgi:hypothetical protein
MRRTKKEVNRKKKRKTRKKEEERSKEKKQFCFESICAQVLLTTER